MAAKAAMGERITDSRCYLVTPQTTPDRSAQGLDLASRKFRERHAGPLKDCGK
jgi:hypothetical protein